MLERALNYGRPVEMRNKLLLAWIVVLLLILNGLVAQKELVLNGAEKMLLQLAPVDPRSLMQGDYMALDYAMPRNIKVGLFDEAPRKGKLVITLDEQKVAKFVRLYRGEVLKEGEYLLNYRKRGRRWRNTIKIATDSYFFQEGTGKHFTDARYGEFRLADSGVCVLVGLVSEDFKPLVPPSP